MSAQADREVRTSNAAYRHLGPAIDVGRQTCVLLCPEAPGSPMVNRVVGLGVGGPAAEEELDAALALVPPGTSFYVSIEPGAEPPTLGAWLAARSLAPGWGWMRFRRGVEVPGGDPSQLRLAQVAGIDQADAFGRIVCSAYGLPAAAATVFHRVLDSPWELWLALDGDEPVGAGGLYTGDGVGYLGFAGTLAEHRGRGAQTLLLRHRIARAAELGCDVVVAETGELRDGLPSNSYRNLLRAGFQETTVVANWLGRA